MNQYKLYTMDDEKSCTDECCEDREIEARPVSSLEAGLSIGTPNLGPVNRGGNRINDLVIKQMDLGYLVKVGCQTLCLETKERLIQLFTDYVNNPEKTIDKYYKNTLLNEETKDDD